MKNTIIVLGILLLVGAIIILTIGDREDRVEIPENETPSEGNEENQETGAELEPLDINNMTYSIEGRAVTLVDGEAEEEITNGALAATMRTSIVRITEGDLNGDGEADRAVMLVQDPGGTGVFYYVAAVFNEGGEARATNSMFIGDRIGVESFDVVDGVIEVSILVRGEGEPLAAEPTVRETMRFVVNDGALVAVEEAE